MMSLRLDQARKRCLENVSVVGSETVPVSRACGRVTARSVRSVNNHPALPIATRDGYGVADADLLNKTKVCFLPIAAEVAAGADSVAPLARKTAVRIMTGAPVPPGADRVVAKENCREVGGMVLVAESSGPSYIRGRGGIIKKNQVLLAKGFIVKPEHVARFAMSGCGKVEVSRKIRVAILCTGSELVETFPAPPGKIIDSNRYLLQALVEESGAETVFRRTVPDNREAVESGLREAVAQEPDIVLTTGGTGPGRYDLVPRCFDGAGGRVLFDGIAQQPGRSTLGGVLGNAVFFALPGPPVAVRTLFSELVRPVVYKAQGRKSVLPEKVRAVLLEAFEPGPSPVQRLRGAIVTLAGERVMVRPADKEEIGNGVLVLAAGRSRYKSGEVMTVHLHGSFVS